MIPKRYESASISDVPENVKEHFGKIKETRRGIYIHGSVGTGKTHIAYALLSACKKDISAGGEVVGTESSATFINASEFFAEMKRDFDRKEKTYPMENLMQSRKLLFIDDIGAEKLSEWVISEFYLLLNHRYNEMLPTIFTSNLSLDELSEKFGERITSRIAGMCDVVELSGVDRRI